MIETTQTFIPLSNLYPNPEWQTRHRLDEENVERLVQAMKEGAVIPAVLVRPADGGRYEVFDGFHRLEAAKQHGLVNLKADVCAVGTDTTELLAEGVRRNLSHGLQLVRDDMKRAARMMYVPGLGGRGKKGEVQRGSAKWVSDVLKVGPSTVRRWVNPEAHSDSLKSAAKNRAIAAANAADKEINKRAAKIAGEEALRDKVLERYGAEALSARYDPVVRWSVNTDPSSPGVPHLMLSDIHYGEVVDPEQVFGSNEFNREVCKRRVEHTVQKAVELLKIHLAKPDYPGIVLVLGGDLISGELHEELMATDEVPPLVQAMEIARILADCVAFLAEEFKQVDIYCVAGNHGRTTRRTWTKFTAWRNLDWLAYQLIREFTSGLQNVKISAPNARDVTFTVAGHRYRLTHGDQFKGGDGIIGPLGPVTRGDVRKRVTASLMPGQPEGYDTLLCGHFHQLIMLPRQIMNGSVKGFDEFALSFNFPWEPPQQALWTVHPKYGQTWYMPVLCDPDYTAHGIRKEEE